MIPPQKPFWILLCLGVGLGVAGRVWAGPAAASVAEAHPKTLTVCADDDFYPYSFRGTDGRLTGFAVDLLDAVARRIDVRIERVPVHRQDTLSGFEKSRCDILQQFAMVPGYEAPVLKSTPYLIQQGVLYVRRGDHRFESLQDLVESGGRIAAAPFGANYAQSRGVRPENLLPMQTRDCLIALAEGRVEAALLSRLTGVAQVERMGLANVQPLARPLKGYVVRYAFGVRPGRAELLALLNEGLASVVQTGEYERIYERWFAPYEPTRFSREEVIQYVASALGLALLVTLWAFVRQRELRRRLARQAELLEESHVILAEAQRLAQLGHWKRTLGPNAEAIWSEQTYRIFERRPDSEPPSLEELVGLAVPEDRPRWSEALRAMTAEGRPYELEVTLEIEPGRVKHVALQGRPIRDAGGRLSGFFGTVQDVSDWRRSQEELRRSERLLRALYENLPHGLGVAELQRDGWRLISINPEGARLLGLVEPPQPGALLECLGLDPGVAALWVGWFDQGLHADPHLKVEHSLPGTRREHALIVVPLDQAEHGARVCFLIEDVTERKLRDAELSQGRRLRAIGELVGGIAHEFNNLLTPIVLSAEALEAEHSGDAHLREGLRAIGAAARRSAELTRRLLTFGRRGDPAKAVDLKEIVDANVDLARHTFDRRIQIFNTVPGGLPPVFAPPGDLHQVALNLLLNARDALTAKLAQPPRGWTPSLWIEGSVRAAPESPGADGGPSACVVIACRDNGCGMSREVMERIFEPFFTTKEVGRGTGLGLATAWHIVTTMGGRIEVDSDEGEGSTFRIVLPVARDSAQPVARPAEPAPAAAASTRRLRVLVAEDEEPISRLVAVMIRRQGHGVDVVADGNAALERIDRELASYDVLLLDVNLPGVSGLDLARRARDSGYGGRVVAMSGRIGEAERVALREIGVDAVLQKPFSLAELSGIVASLPGQSRSTG